MRLPATVLILFFVAGAAHAQEHVNPQPFGLWLNELRAEATARGIRAATLDAALSGIQPDPNIVELDRKQPESTLTYKQYLKRVLPKSRIAKAKQLYRENLSLLRRIGAQYGVQPQYIVALWGMESSFGENTGGYNVIEALATLAYDGRRSNYFRGELLDALTILDQGHIATQNMTGSWAGAMGQCQFMPKSFLRFAVDADGDGHKDIWRNKADVFASIANYLHREGWNPKARATGGKHPSVNYKVLLKWNRSRYFASSVSMLADTVAKGL